MNTFVLGLILFLTTVDGTEPLSEPQVSTPGNLNQTAETPRRFAVDHDFHDFKDVYPYQSVTHDFPVKNISVNPIQISELITDCGCTAAVVDSETILPDGEVKIQVTFTADQLKGPVEKKITVYLEETVPFELTIKANVCSVIDTSPRHVYLKDVHYGEKTEKDVVITVSDDKDVKIIGVELVEGRMDVQLISGEEAEVSEVSTNPKEWILRLTLPEDTPAGNFSAKIRIKTDFHLQPEYILPVLAYVQGQITIRPTQCYLGTLHPGEQKEQNYRISKIGDASLIAPVLESDLETLEWSIETKKDGAEYTIKTKITVPENHQGRLTGQIKVLTGDDVQPEFIIPVFGYVPQDAAGDITAEKPETAPS